MHFKIRKHGQKESACNVTFTGNIHYKCWQLKLEFQKQLKNCFSWKMFCPVPVITSVKKKTLVGCYNIFIATRNSASHVDLCLSFDQQS